MSIPGPDQTPLRPRVESDLIGPLWTTDDVLDQLGVYSRHGLALMVARCELLQVRTSDDWALYPVFQFGWQEVRADVRLALQRFRGTPVDSWAIAVWFRNPSAVLDERTPLEWLTDRTLDNDVVYQLASDTAARWSAL